MKLNYLLLLATIAIYGQDKTGIPNIGLPRIDMSLPEKSTNNNEYSISKPFEITKFKTPTKIYSPPTLNTPNKFNTPKSDFKPGKIYADKLNKINGNEENSDFKLYRKNMFLGDFKVNSKKIGIFYRDFGLVDGDLIRVWVNDKIVMQEIFLGSNFEKLDLELGKGINKIDFEALTQGTSGPNTAEFKIYDDSEKLVSENMWNLGTGFKATVIINKE